MDEFLNRLIADGIVATDDEVQAHKAEILGRAKDLVTAAGAQIKSAVNASIGEDNLGLFGNPIKPALENAIDDFIDKMIDDFDASEGVWLSKIAAAAQEYAITLSK